jgi:hypothetical protein
MRSPIRGKRCVLDVRCKINIVFAVVEISTAEAKAELA